MRLPGTLEGLSVPGKGKIGVPGTLGPFSVPGSPGRQSLAPRQMPPVDGESRFGAVHPGRVGRAR